ncbi:MAG TPA: spore coat associated protein CotJA [Clostridiaceae bacterium]|nr:spore coat associated protein CotJA [Clostridiaceae bacterium]
MNNVHYAHCCYPETNLARAYIPFQELNCVYLPMVGLGKGTIFPELDRPYGVDPEYTVDH